jgi:hypothetical protein
MPAPALVSAPSATRSRDEVMQATAARAMACMGEACVSNERCLETEFDFDPTRPERGRNAP